MVTDVNKKTFDELLADTNGADVVFADFWADWCGPCKMVEPVVKELATDYDGKINFVKINVDENPELAAQYGVRSIPTFIMMHKNGDLLFKHSGAIPKNALNDKIKSFVK